MKKPISIDAIAVHVAVTTGADPVVYANLLRLALTPPTSPPGALARLWRFLRGKRLKADVDILSSTQERK